MAARVHRLLRGGASSEDLTRLFLFARDRCDGRETVQEIGDFIAHHAERDPSKYKGILTHSVRDFFYLARFHAQWTSYPGRDLLFVLPAETPGFLRATMRTLGLGHLRAAGLRTRKIGTEWAEDLIQRLGENGDGTYNLRPYSDAEIDRFIELAGKMTLQPAFTGERLFEEFRRTLASHGLLQKQENAEILKQKGVILLFALANMHRTKVLVSGKEIELLCDRHYDTLGISAHVPVDVHGKTVGPGGSIVMATRMFATDLNVSEHVHPVLHELKSWPFPLEVGAKGVLQPLVVGFPG